MADSPSSKRFKYGSSVDRISNLPEALIHRILSFLPTNMVVATSLLSKRWVSVWTSVPALDFQDSDSCKTCQEAKVKFMQFVYNALLLNKSGSLETFRLHCNPTYGQTCINTWIRSAVDRALYLEEADISVSKAAGEESLLKLPSGLFLVKTLKILKLGGDVMVDLGGPISLPSLKRLHLVKVGYANGKSFRWLLSGCVVLRELVVVVSRKKMSLNISSPTLETLSLTKDNFGSQLKVEIDAPALKQLKLEVILMLNLRVKHLSCLIEADIRAGAIHGGIRLFRALSNVKCLHLCSGRTEVLADSFPSFANLTRLELPYGARWDVVSLFLQKSNKLETLEVCTKEMFTKRNGVRLCWTQPNPVPVCFLSCLKRVCFTVFKGSEDELKMVEYFFSNARVLETMEIICTEHVFRFKVLHSREIVHDVKVFRDLSAHIHLKAKVLILMAWVRSSGHFKMLFLM